MQLTWFDSNSWLIEIGGQRILLDPWLVDDLVFGNLPWLFRGIKTSKRDIPDRIDLILLSQGLEDHAHPPTLKKLDKSIPVIASPGGAKVAKELGYTKVTPLQHGQELLLDTVKIKAVIGSPIGPTTLENGYILTDLTDNKSLYYEPHGYHSPTLKESVPIDVVITPIIDLKIPVLGSVIKGESSALELCQWLKPQVIIPTAAGGDISFEGLLISLLKAAGSPEQFRQKLTDNGLDTQVIDPQPGQTFTPLLN
ncbi:MAG: hypothetical protein N5P05_003050 [Chroococcopsis gigantea SAG 12.99]|jgi:L-ascorbate metabolism protein UlaG (beta-lactamase superfamily)|nr:MBL fold metallo-hydrolase [Chlorogloea purpurea SAG 13.99]MDV3001444.1 hypothetical protein [Chroococcopsis gigantea SAG 12.99]